MRVDVDVNFRSVKIIQPSEGSGDEPYLWTFVFKLDRETVHQQPSGSFVGTVQVTTAPGSHGNLGVEDRGSGPLPVMLPDPLGHHVASLRAITMRFGGTTALCPAKLFMITALLEEDLSTSDGLAEANHQSLRAFYEKELNGFIAGLDPNEVVAAAAGGSPIAVVEQRIEALVARLAAAANQWVTLGYLEKSSAFAFWEDFDRDDFITATPFAIDERIALDAPPGPDQPVKIDLVQLEDGHFACWYEVSGSRVLRIQAESIDFLKVGEVAEEVPNTSVEGSATFTEANAGLCVTAGRTVTWTRRFHREVESFRFVYPFLSNVAFSVDGQDLKAGSPSVAVPTTVTVPRFDTASPGRPVWDAAQKTVTVKYQLDPDGRGVSLTNDPADGSYTVTVRIDGLLGGPSGTRVPLASLPAAFDGQVVESAWYAEYDACVDRFRSPGEDYAKSKRIGPKELWGPGARLRWFEQQRKRGQELLSTGQIPREVFEVGLRQLENRAAVKHG